MLMGSGAYADTIKVGVVGPFSGPFALQGKNFKAGIDAYMATNGAKIGDNTVEVIYRDLPAADPAQSKALAQELVVKEKVQYLAGFYFTPDAMAVIKDLERPADAPALQNFDLSQLSAALNGVGGAEGFGGSEMGLASGGRIGGTGKIGGSVGDTNDDTFGTADIDQKPRAVFQATPVFPNEMRGKDIEGAVVVIFIVTPDGRVTNQRAESSNNAAFEKPALDAVLNALASP